MFKTFILSLFLISNFTYARGTTERAGDILTLLIPSVAYGTTLVTGDKDGQMEFYKSYGSTVALTSILKKTVRERRPNNSSSTASFPSGHTSSAFSGATFIHKKYGIEYAIPAYLGAIYTGYSRVHAQKHYTHDVIAGALLGMGLSWYFTSDKGSVTVSPLIDAQTDVGVRVSYNW